MTNPSVTLQSTGIAQAVDDRERYDSARTKVLALDHATQLQEVKAIMFQPEFALGSVHAITRDGTLVIASALGSQLASYAWGAANVIFVVGAQKLVPDLAAAHERVYQHSLELEDARALEAYGTNSRVGKILEIQQEDPRTIAGRLPLSHAMRLDTPARRPEPAPSRCCFGLVASVSRVEGRTTGTDELHASRSREARLSLQRPRPPGRVAA